jgi:hypothetical protein
MSPFHLLRKTGGNLNQGILEFDVGLYLITDQYHPALIKGDRRGIYQGASNPPSPPFTKGGLGGFFRPWNMFDL